MSSLLHSQLTALFDQPAITGVLALRQTPEGVLPHIFCQEDAANGWENLALTPKWLLAKSVWHILTHLPEGERLGVLCRACDARSLNNLARLHQVESSRLELVHLPCNAEQIAACRCPHPEWPLPSTKTADQQLTENTTEGVTSETPLPPSLTTPCTAQASPTDWTAHFQRCIKCYGCRTACPVCVCPTCRLEDDSFLPVGLLPPAPLAYHLVRVMHVADVCSGCGACQDACPSGLPLLELSRAVLNSLETRFAYQPGCSTGPSPLLTAHCAEGPTGTPAPAWPCSAKSTLTSQCTAVENQS